MGVAGAGFSARAEYAADRLSLRELNAVESCVHWQGGAHGTVLLEIPPLRSE
jgi:hypothetical protein